jgi:hypothetical protein
MRLGSLVVTIVILLAAILGFHWISYPGHKGQTFCVLPKDHLSFDETVVTGDSLFLFAVQHPIFTSQIAAGKGVCLNR